MDDPRKARDCSRGQDARAPGNGATCLVGPRRSLVAPPSDVSMRSSPTSAARSADLPAPAASVMVATPSAPGAFMAGLH